VDPLLLRGAFRVAVLILALALVTLPFQRPGSAELVVTVLAVTVGAIFAIGIAVLARISEPRLPDDRPGATGYKGRSTGREDRP
jgi:hypothetical protein